MPEDVAANLPSTDRRQGVRIRVTGICRSANKLLGGRENDRWGVGFFHYGVTEPLLAGLDALGVSKRSFSRRSAP